MKNLHELPKFADKLSYLYVEHAVIEQADKAIAVHDADGTTPVPAASLAVLVLGPGTSITHAAVRSLADNNCQVIWSGEQGVRFYAHGVGGARHSRNLVRQAQLVSDDIRRLQVVVRMYTMRFTEPVDGSLTLQQLRGKEGIRVRQAYAEASRRSGVPWEGRNYQRKDWFAADPVNRALSAANACLYGIVHAAILSGGYSPALGFIHTGKQLSFVYDIADLYKAQFVIPAAFEAAKNPVDVERRVRLGCRDAFVAEGLIERILPDIHKVLDIPEEIASQEDEFADDEARPSELWQPRVVSADTPIGQILQLRPLVADLPDKGTDHGDSDPGTGHALPAG
jgi:CRISPR-associated protein Cas1